MYGKTKCMYAFNTFPPVELPALVVPYSLPNC